MPLYIKDKVFIFKFSCHYNIFMMHLCYTDVYIVKKWKHPSTVAPSKISISRSIVDPISQFVGVPSRLESFLKDLVEILAWDTCAECHFGLAYKFQVWLRILQLSSTLFHLENEVLSNFSVSLLKWKFIWVHQAFISLCLYKHPSLTFFQKWN